jgi:hypothetical protein
MGFYGGVRGGYLSPDRVAQAQRKNGAPSIGFEAQGSTMGGHRVNYKFCETCQRLRPCAGVSKKGWKCSDCKGVKK